MLTFRERIENKSPIVVIEKIPRSGKISADYQYTDNIEVDFNASSFAYRYWDSECYEYIITEVYADYEDAMLAMVEYIRKNITKSIRNYSIDTIRKISKYNFCGIQKWIDKN